MVLLLSGITIWLGAAGATAAGHDPVAVAAIPTGAALIGAAAYYSRVRKFAGVELTETVLEAGGSYEAPVDATPTEAVQGFARSLAEQIAEPEDQAAIPRPPYFLHVDRAVPRGMVVRATWEATEDFASYLQEHGWDVEREAPLDDGRTIDLMASRGREQLWVQVKGTIYALNPSIIREIAERLSLPDARQEVRVRQALFLPIPPLAISPEALADLREHKLELWYADSRAPQGFVRAA